MATTFTVKKYDGPADKQGRRSFEATWTDSAGVEQSQRFITDPAQWKAEREARGDTVVLPGARRARKRGGAKRRARFDKPEGGA